MRTAVGHGLVGPKRSGDAVPRVRDCVAGWWQHCSYVTGVPTGFCRRRGWAHGNMGLPPVVGRGRRPSSWCSLRKGRVAEGRRARQRKGTRSRFLDRDGGACDCPSGPHHGDVNEPRDIDGGPREGSLPSLTVLRSSVLLSGGAGGRAQAPTALESTRSEIGLNGWQSAPVFGASGAPSPILENLGEVAQVRRGGFTAFTAGLESSHPSVLITASGPQGEKPLAGRIT